MSLFKTWCESFGGVYETFLAIDKTKKSFILFSDWGPVLIEQGFCKEKDWTPEERRMNHPSNAHALWVNCVIFLFHLSISYQVHMSHVVDVVCFCFSKFSHFSKLVVVVLHPLILPVISGGPPVVPASRRGGGILLLFITIWPICHTRLDQNR